MACLEKLSIVGPPQTKGTMAGDEENETNNDQNTETKLYAVPLSSFPGCENKEDAHIRKHSSVCKNKDGEEWTKNGFIRNDLNI